MQLLVRGLFFCSSLCSRFSKYHVLRYVDDVKCIELIIKFRSVRGNLLSLKYRATRLQVPPIQIAHMSCVMDFRISGELYIIFHLQTTAEIRMHKWKISDLY